MKFQVIASGSKGNLTYIETDEAKVLIDAGISLRDVLSRTKLNFDHLDAIFVTHEHVDHVRYIENIARKTNAIIFVNELSFKQVFIKYIKNLEGLKIKYIKPNEQIAYKDIKILPLNLQHDTECCYGYIFVSKGKSIAYCTDTGFIPTPYIDILKKVNVLIIESNHDVEMLMNSERPWQLKNRILSINGHMSNKICGDILNKILPNDVLKYIILAHLSEECNTEEVATDTILSCIETNDIPMIYVAKQKEALPLLEV